MLHLGQTDTSLVRTSNNGRSEWMLTVLLQAGSQTEHLGLTMTRQGCDSHESGLAFRQGARLINDQGIHLFQNL